MKKNYLLVLFFPLLLSFSILKGASVEPTISFSHERGFYYKSFELALNSNSNTNTLKYTFDGGNPLTSNSAVSIPFPATIKISPHINEGRALTPAVVFRACAISATDTSEVVTQTYIFLSEVKFQPDVSPAMAPYWPEESFLRSTYHPDIVDWMKSDYQYIDLGIDPEVVVNEEYFSDFEPALLSIPSISLATEPSNLFKDSTGIYINATWHGKEWERPASIEFIYPNGEGAQSNAGIRMRGGFSRLGGVVKHSFRVFFRDEYGNGKFDFSLFEDEGVSTFDKIDIKSSQNNSWHIGNGSADFVHETFARDIQGAMGDTYTRSRFYHLYINGMYWGIYETQERPEASFAASYLGGNKDDYDVIKSTGPSYDAPSYTIEATDGNLDAAYALWQIAKEGFTDANYYKVLGQNADGTTNVSYPKLVDENNLIDYMILIYFSANGDGPADFNGGVNINNFFGIYNRVKPDGFKFIVHDAETTFANINDNITNRPTVAGELFDTFNPAWLHQKLMENNIYKQKFADKAYKLLYNDGILSANENIIRFSNRSQMIDMAIIGESARWGDVNGGLFTKNKNWLPIINRFLNNYFPARTDIVISQFKEMGWLNNIEPPQLDENDFIVPNDKGDLEVQLSSYKINKGDTFKLINNNNSGKIYYTLNNVDPKDKNGGIMLEALEYGDKIPALQTIFLKARVKDGDSWSPLTEQIIEVLTDMKLVISEINYNPAQQIIGNDTLSSKNLEFIEIKNFSKEDIDLSAYKFSKGIDFVFPYNSIIKSDSLIVIVADSVSFKKVYGFTPFGQFNGNLNNNGEQILVSNPFGEVFLNFGYNAGYNWYEATNGGGFTLVYLNYENYQSATVKENWRVSTNRLGSPGKDDPTAITYDIKFTEVLANSEAPISDAIELYNNSTTDIDLSGWYLTDNASVLNKWKIPEGTVIPTKDYMVFYEGHYENNILKFAENEFGQAFSISSGGEHLLLSSNNELGGVGQFVCEYEIEPTDKNISFGEYASVSRGIFHVQLDSQFFGSNNAKSYKSPVIFKTIMYHPVNGNYEYLVLKNRTDSVVNLYHETDAQVTWKINGIGFSFPQNTSIQSGDSLYIVEQLVSASIFKSYMNLGDEVQVFNFSGKLNNGGETISLEKPIIITSNDTVEYVYVNQEIVTFNDKLPWPESADGDGYALQRINDELFANEASNWSVILNTIPVADAGTIRRIRVNNEISLNGLQSFDPGGNSLNYKWEIVEKPNGSEASLADATNVISGFTPDVAGEYILSLQVDNNKNNSVPSYLSVLAFENRVPFALMSSKTISTKIDSITQLNATRSYDPDYESLNYAWELISSPDGSSAQLNSATSVIAEFIPDIVGKYTLTLTVYDGEMYSDPITVTVNAKPATDLFEHTFVDNLLIYPNPVSSKLNIDFYLNKPLPINIIITDINGKNLYNRVLENSSVGSNNIQINMQSLNIASGIYVLHMRSEEGIVSQKIVYTR